MEKSKIRKSIIKAIQLISANSNQKIHDTDNMIEAWHIVLETVADDKIGYGLKKALNKNSPFMITSGQFKELCLTGDGCQSLEEEAVIAWNTVHENLNSYASPIFKDSVISETIRKMGGWVKLCSMLITDEPFRKKEFVSLYQVMKRQGVEFKPMLVGRFKDPVFIGYDKNDNLDQILIDVDEFKKSESKMIEMINEK